MTSQKEDTDAFEENSALVLTSEKRRGVFECDYCHSDISQQPRIRCAVCADFDLCLDCFSTVDHAAMMARIKAATQTQAELSTGETDATSLVGVAISSAAVHHEDDHCYRVCDSTRFPAFPAGRITVPAAVGKKSDNDKNRMVTDETIGVEVNDKVEEGKSDNDKMHIDGEQENEDGKISSSPLTITSPAVIDSTPLPSKNNKPIEISVSEDPKSVWTVEEDLRLIDAIQTHGLGNWVDIAEAIGGEGSVGKTPKRCMERYLDDFLGRYGHILPPWTIVDDITEYNATDIDDNHNNNNSNIPVDASVTKDSTNANESDDTHIGTNNAEEHNNNKMEDTGKEELASRQQTQSEKNNQSATTETGPPTAAVKETTTAVRTAVGDEEGVRTSKRRSYVAGMRSSALGATVASVAGSGRSSRKKLKVVPTESLLDYDKIWPRPYLPAISGAVAGKEVARDLSYKAEIAFVKSTLALSSKEEADKIRQEWVETKLGRIGSPTVLPPRPDDAAHLLGSELAGFMPRRGDFDVEWENDAESALADMEFTRSDTPEEKQLKLKVLDIYCQKLDEREKRKTFVLNRHLYDYRKYVQDDQKLPVDECDLVHRMRLFERFHTPDEHKRFIADILKAKRLRKEIAKLQMYRRIGIRSLLEAEMYELDKDRRQFHKIAHLKKESDAKTKAVVSSKGATTASGVTLAGAGFSQANGTDSLWKQYRTNDRKNRRNSTRQGSSIEGISNALDGVTAFSADGTTEKQKKEDKHNAKNATIERKMPPLNTSTEVSEKIPDQEEKVSEGEISNQEMTSEKSKKSNEQDDEVMVDTHETFDISRARCRDLLSRKELALCERLQVYPVQYLDIKKALIHESLVNGLLDRDSSNSGRRTIVKIDVERRGNIVDFLVRAGWISKRLADVALRVVTPQPT